MSGPDLEITGGAGGVEARYEDLATLAGRSVDLGGELAGISASCHAVLVDPDLLASALLHPQGVAEVEKLLLGALDGPHGLTALSARLVGRGAALRTVSTGYQLTDAAQADLLAALRWSAGYLAAPLLLATLASPLALLALGGGVAGANAAGVDWQRLLTDHPGILDNLIGAGPGLVTGLGGPPVFSVPAAAHLLALLYPDGGPTVTPLGVDSDDPRMTRVPGSFEDLMSGLNYRNSQAHGDQQGQIDVRVITHADGTKAYIVDIPGTKDWHPVPLQDNRYLNDLGTNLHGIAGDTTAYEKGVAEALRQAGAGPHDPVMLVGHSQGGIVATQAAADLTRSGQYSVTHVVTAGSPVGGIDVPDSVQVLSLENQHDIVPHLDAADNPDRPNRTTVSFDSQYGTVGDNHGIGTSYLPAAKALDGSTDPSVLAYRSSASPFLSNGDGAQVTSYVYQVTRH